jgi:ribose transport system substrate-binding protein
MRSKRIGLAALLTVGMLVTACSSATTTPAPSVAAPSGVAPSGAAPVAKLGTIAFIPGELANPSQAYSWKVVQRDAAKYGFDAIVLDGKKDVQEQVKAINSAVAQKVVAILVNPNDAKAIVPALTAARKAGVVVGISMAKAADGTEGSYDFWVSVDDKLGGQTAAKAILAAFPNATTASPVTGVEIGGQAGHPAAIDRHDGFTSGIAGKPITVLDYKNPQAWDTAQAQAIAENMITKYGTKIQFIFCHWDNGATGVINALKAKGGMDNVLIIGVDGNKTGFAQVKSWPNYISIAQNVDTILDKEMAEARLFITKDASATAANIVPFDIISKATIANFQVPEW